MTHIDGRDGRLEKAYMCLCKVLRDPQDFGLGPRVPPPLKNILEKTLSMLAEVMREKGSDSTGNLEAELSQDADRHDQQTPGCA
jgi:hypothetical protein